MFCTRCRKKLSDDASFCTCCGQPTASSPKATDTVDLKMLLYGPLLTVITVLLTVMTAVELVNFNFYAILFIPLVVGMWLIFSGVFAKSDKLLKLTLDVAGKERTVVSGIAQYYTPEYMVGKTVVIVKNLKPVKLRGILSEGMILCASNGKDVVFVTPEKEIESGSGVN